MAVKDWGKKFVCYKCGCKFYDLKKEKALCPKCGADQADRRVFDEEVVEEEEFFDEDRLPVADDEEVPEMADEMEEEMPPMQEDLGYDETEEEEE